MKKQKKKPWGYRHAVMVYEVMLWLLTIAAAAGAGVLFFPKLAGVRPYVILSSSMEPAIAAGSLIFVNTRDRKAEEGDVVTFLLGEEGRETVVTHRIHRVTKEGYITKGDHNDVADPAFLTQERIIGTCIGILPRAGYGAAALNGKGAVWAAAVLFGMHVFGIMLDMPEVRKD